MKNSLLALFALSTLLSCRKQQDPLPDAVPGAGNVFACHVNGKNWVAKSSLFDPKYISGGVSINPVDSTRYIWLTGTNEGTSVSLYTGKINGPGVYPLNQSACPRPACISKENYGSFSASGYPGDFYMTGSQATGVLYLETCDTIANRLRGTFSFDAENEGGKTVQVRDGRFIYSMNGN